MCACCPLPLLLPLPCHQHLFDPFGTIVHYKLVLDKRDLTSKGYGFVKFEDDEQASAAVAAMNGIELWGVCSLPLFPVPPFFAFLLPLPLAPLFSLSPSLSPSLL